jgi:hypothetical protein
LICTGFAGEMLAELETSRSAPFGQHLNQWMELLLPAAATSSAPARLAVAA